MKDNDNLIERMMQGIPINVSENERLIIITPSMTTKQYAAVNLRVPRSGDPKLDAMIRESRRFDFAEKVVIEMLNAEAWNGDVLPSLAFRCADVMLAEWEKEAKGAKGD
jgi:hypothetical protein